MKWLSSLFTLLLVTFCLFATTNCHTVSGQWLTRGTSTMNHWGEVAIVFSLLNFYNSHSPDHFQLKGRMKKLQIEKLPELACKLITCRLGIQKYSINRQTHFLLTTIYYTFLLLQKQRIFRNLVNVVIFLVVIWIDFLLKRLCPSQQVFVSASYEKCRVSYSVRANSHVSMLHVSSGHGNGPIKHAALYHEHGQSTSAKGFQGNFLALAKSPCLY